MVRVANIAKELGIGTDTIIKFLKEQGIENPGRNTKVTKELYELLHAEHKSDIEKKEEASRVKFHSTEDLKKIEVTSTSPLSQFEAQPQEKSVEKTIESDRLEKKEPDTKKEKALESQEKKDNEKISLRPSNKFKEVHKVDISKLVPEKKQEKKPEIKKEEKKSKTRKVQPPKKIQTQESTKPDQQKRAAAETPSKEDTKQKEKIIDQKLEAATLKIISEEKKQPLKELKNKGVEKEVIQDKKDQESEDNNLIKGRHGKLQGLKVVNKIKLHSTKPEPKPLKEKPKKEVVQNKKRGKIDKVAKLSPKTESNKTDKIAKPSSKTENKATIPKRTRIARNKKDDYENNNQSKTRYKKNNRGEQFRTSQEDINKSYKATLAKFKSDNVRNLRSSSRRYRQEKREQIRSRQEEESQQETKVINVTEFISVSDLANIMDVKVNELITACLNIGSIVTINHRLDKATIELLADEFMFKIQFNTIEEETDIIDLEKDNPKDLVERSPIVTVMGHVDHGKTSLLDYIRNTNVVSSESGGITQHIGSYEAYTQSNRRIIFLDTPGHEAFTSMRARGASITDVAIIVIAADDGVKPRTLEAISHAQIANIPIVFAINKIDKPDINIDNVKQQLSQHNILVDDWGGKYQCFPVSAKTGQGVDELLEGVLLESDIMELKANPNRKSLGVVIESSLDKGRGYVANLLVQTGTLRVGDVILAGTYHGKIKAFMNYKGTYIDEAGPATPVQILGFNGAPQAGEKFNILENEKKAKEIASKRGQLLREQSVRATKRLTLQDIGDRIAQGNFQELKIILKGDVDGSIEALVGLLLKLSTSEVAVRIIHKAVGAISESDIMLASASGSVIIGFQVRPIFSAKKIAEKEEVEIRLYSVIYDIVDDIKHAIEGLLKPKIEEQIVGNIIVREVFKTRVGKIAGSYVSEGYIKRNSMLRLVRDGVVIYTGVVNTLKRMKDDITEVKFGFECGVTIKDFNDIKIGDTIEVYKEVEVKVKV